MEGKVGTIDESPSLEITDGVLNDSEQQPDTLDEAEKTGLLNEALEAQQANKNEKELSIREINLEQLKEHYGDQKFRYESSSGKVYTGTVSLIVTVCPAFKHLLDLEGGAALAISTLDQYKYEKEEPTEEKKSADDEEATTAKNPGDTLEDKKDRQSSAKETSKPEIEKPQAQAPKELKQAKVNSTDKKTAVETVSVQIDASPIVKKEIINKKETALELSEERRPAHTTKEVVEPISIEQVAPKLPELVTVENPTTREIESSDLFEQVVENESIIESDIVVPEVTEEEIVIHHEKVAEEVSEIITIPRSELLAEWHEIGEAETPLEVALATLIDQIQHLEESQNETEASEDTIEKTTFDAPEIHLILTKVEKTRKAIERLQTATTKEECAEHVQEVVKELSQLLTLLGYENPTEIIQEFLAKYPIQSLHDLLEYLETSLRQSIERDTRKKLSGASLKHTSLLAQLAMRITQVIAPHYETA